MRERLDQFLTQHPELSLGAATNILVDEALRMREHPQIVFRDGPMGRRARVVGGPDVWEVIAAIRSARKAEPGLSQTSTVDLVVETSGLTKRQVTTAIDYWSEHESEVDQMIEAAEAAAERAMKRQRNEQNLLAG